MTEETKLLEEIYALIKDNEPCYFTTIYMTMTEKYAIHDIIDALWYLQEERKIVLDEAMNYYSIWKEA